MKAVKNYLSLVKFSHTIFAMPFALIGFALAVVPPIKHRVGAQLYSEHDRLLFGYRAASLDGMDILTKLVLVVLCMVFARSAAMAFNRYLDKHFDALNP